jgi:hypothetical protein
MISTTDKQTRPRWFDEHAEEWVEHGFVTSDQIEAIRTYEHLDVTTPPRISMGAELAVYLGSVVALMSGAIMVGQSWDSLATGGRAAIGLALAVLGFVAGERLIRLDDAPTRRLASFMWLIGTGGVALTAATLADRARFENVGGNLITVGIPVLLVGAALWRNLDRPLQMLTTAVGVGLVAGGTAALLSIPVWLGAILAWSAGIAVGAAALTDRLRPELYVLAVAAAWAMFGALMLSDLSELAGSIAATITAALVVVVGLGRHLVPILVIGILAFLMALQGLLVTTLNGAAAALGVAVAGLAVVVVAIVRTTHAKAPPTT